METERDRARASIAVPAATAAPLVASVGVTLVLSGLVTNATVSALGAILFVSAAVAWFREVLPHERHEPAALERPPAPIAPVRRAVRRLATAAGPHRARLPVEVYPLSAGIRGGIAGGVAMAALAVLHGLINHASLWYTINLLAAAASARLSSASPEALLAFSAEGLALALVIHSVLSVMVGLLYGALLPMFPRRPVLWGGVVAPLLWTGLIAATLDLINPALNQRIEWPWFLASQIAFGLVAGLVVTRSARIATFQHASFAHRAGLETQDEQ
jgi:hypothetical protein